MNSLYSGPLRVIKRKKTVLEIQEALEHKYTRTEEVLLYSYIENYARIDFNQYNDVLKYRLAFTDVRNKLESLGKIDIKDQYPIMFVIGLLKDFPEWA